MSVLYAINLKWENKLVLNMSFVDKTFSKNKISKLKE